jgi:hypothetical protein
VSEKADTVTMRQMRSRATTRRILAGETLVLRMGSQEIADIVPRRPTGRKALHEILAPVKAAADKLKPGRNLILDDRQRFRR